MDPQRRSALLAIKLAALVRDHTRAGDHPSNEEQVRGVLTGAAALTTGNAAWVLLDDRPERGLGSALAWAVRAERSVVNILTESAAGTLARRARFFDPAPTVWAVNERELVAAAPADRELVPDVDGRVVHFADLIEAGGAVPVIERGVLLGEVGGLEVCRAVVDRATETPRLEVGVGAHDREAFLMMHGDNPSVEVLAGVVQYVAKYRFSVVDYHPLHHLAAERLIRARLIGEPELVDVAVLEPADPPVARVSIKDPVPCVATGFDCAGEAVVVVCSHGIDLDLVPFAADARAMHGGRLIVVAPERDLHPVNQMLMSQLREPGEFRSIH